MEGRSGLGCWDWGPNCCLPEKWYYQAEYSIYSHPFIPSNHSCPSMVYIPNPKNCSLASARIYIDLNPNQFNCAFSGIILNMSGIVSIQGNLGAGKTTLLSLLNISSIKQPVDEWQNIKGVNILKNYYEEPKRWAFTFQLNAIHSRNRLWKEIIQKEPHKIHYSERSPMADRYVFGEIMYRQGNLDPAEYAIYSDICSSVIEQCPLKAIIYLKCSPEMCLARIKHRNRKGEEGISLEYLRKVHERHQEWLSDVNTLPIITIDTEVYDVCDEAHQREIADKITGFLNKISIMERVSAKVKPNIEKTLYA